jgi:arylsulfatase A-like enzyme
MLHFFSRVTSSFQLTIACCIFGCDQGEHGEWEKKSNFDLVVKVPLLIVVPWKSSTSAGKKTASLVDLVDVGPTVEALAGLPVDPLVDGTDVSALLDDPTAEPKKKQPAFHQYVHYCATTPVLYLLVPL